MVLERTSRGTVTNYIIFIKISLVGGGKTLGARDWLIWSVWSLWFVLLVWLIWFIWLVSFNQTNKTNQIASRRGEVGIMSQDMAPSPYNPKRLLLKMPYRFNKGYQLLVHSSACVLCGWFFSLDLHWSQP